MDNKELIEKIREKLKERYDHSESISSEKEVSQAGFEAGLEEALDVINFIEV